MSGKPGGLKECFLDPRQDLIVSFAKCQKEEQLEQISNSNTDIVADRSYQNIVSSYVSADVF